MYNDIGRKTITVTAFSLSVHTYLIWRKKKKKQFFLETWRIDFFYRISEVTAALRSFREPIKKLCTSGFLSYITRCWKFSVNGCFSEQTYVTVYIYTIHFILYSYVSYLET